MSLVMVMIATIASNAQTPIPDPDTIRDPVKQGDPAVQVIPRQVQYEKNFVKIKPTEVPAEVKKRLQHTAYKGWEKATIYRNQSSTIYMVEFQEPNKTRIYKFDKHGQQLEDE